MQTQNSVSGSPAIDDNPFTKLHRVLEEQDVLATLRVLNAQAPHRFTGIYKYTPTILKNIYLVDAFAPQVTKGDDVPNEDAYCLLLGDKREVSFGVADDAPCPIKLASPVVSYCGVLLTRANGEPFGSLCHFDVARCQEPATQMHYLNELAPSIMAQLEAEGH